jgi:hypothetical protein
VDNSFYDQFLKTMSALSEIYGFTLSEGAFFIYLQSLSTLSLDEFNEAINRHVATNKFFPKISELLAYISGDSQDQIKIAWVRILALHSRSSWDNMITMIPDKILAENIKRLGGLYGPIMRLKIDDFLRQRELFEACYKELARETEGNSIAYVEGKKLVSWPEQGNYAPPQIRFLLKECWNKREIELHKPALMNFMPDNWQLSLDYSDDKTDSADKLTIPEHNEPKVVKKAKIKE